MVRTRFAPSPTGYLHIGGVRTALFSWAYAKKYQGQFILRIEDTDLERSTPESVKAILDGMSWVGLKQDEGPFYQTEKINRYKEVIQKLLDEGKAYYCYTSKEELNQLRAEAEKNSQGFLYDRKWRPEPNKVLPPIPLDTKPVVRFKMPIDGSTQWNDLVKGEISISNNELDDFIIARDDGTPTYNFCVVVDDYDMNITHIIRGDDHVNNTPKQINIWKVLNSTLPYFAHLPMIFNESGTKMSKRRDAVSVVDYDKQGILPEALLNYLARLGWGHGDDEIFSLNQFIEWFDLQDISPSPSRFNHEKLLWLNQQYIKSTENDQLAGLIAPRIEEHNVTITEKIALVDVIALVKDRVNNLNDLALESLYFYKKLTPSETELDKHWSKETEERMSRFAQLLENQEVWSAESIHELFPIFCEQENIKMGKLGMPLRILVCGTTKTPSIDQVLALLGKEEVLERMKAKPNYK